MHDHARPLIARSTVTRVLLCIQPVGSSRQESAAVTLMRVEYSEFMKILTDIAECPSKMLNFMEIFNLCALKFTMHSDLVS